MRSGIVQSFKGASGGFTLKRDAQELTVLEIIAQLDGPLKVFECFSDGSDCSHYGNCKILSVFNMVSSEIEKVLANVRLADFVSQHSSSSRLQQLETSAALPSSTE